MSKFIVYSQNFCRKTLILDYQPEGHMLCPNVIVEEIFCSYLNFFTIFDYQYTVMSFHFYQFLGSPGKQEYILQDGSVACPSPWGLNHMDMVLLFRNGCGCGLCYVWDGLFCFVSSLQVCEWKYATYIN